MFKEYCSCTSLHGWQYLPWKQEKGACCSGFHRLYWILVLVLSWIAAAYFLVLNITEFRDKTVLTSLVSTTEDLTKVYFPAVTVCSMNQIQTSFLKKAGLAEETKRKERAAMLNHIFFGAENQTQEDKQHIENMISNPFVQIEFCETYNDLRPPAAPPGKMVDNKCVVEGDSGNLFYSFFNLMSSQYKEGYTVLSATFNKTTKYDRAAQTGTDMGLCDTIVPSVDFNTSIPPKDSWKYWTLVEEGTANGLVNGMKLLIDIEAYNHGSHAKSSGGAAFIIHHHRDHPIMQLSGGLSTAAGSEIDIGIEPVLTVTTKNALDTFTPTKRQCYLDDEIELTYLPSILGYRYSYTNCMFESAYEEALRTCGCGIASHDKIVNLATMLRNESIANLKETCTGEKLHCAIQVFDKISKMKTIYDQSDNKEKECLPACFDQINQITYSKANYPIKESFLRFQDFCLIFLKLMDECNISVKAGIISKRYPSICPGMLAMKSLHETDKAQRGIDSTSKNRNIWVIKYCTDESMPWVDVIIKTLNSTFKETFIDEMTNYASENMLKANVYITRPFVTIYEREVETTFISLIANVGGLMGLCMGFSLVSIFEILFFCVASVFRFRLCASDGSSDVSSVSPLTVDG